MLRFAGNHVLITAALDGVNKIESPSQNVVDGAFMVALNVELKRVTVSFVRTPHERMEQE